MKPSGFQTHASAIRLRIIRNGTVLPKTIDATKVSGRPASQSIKIYLKKGRGNQGISSIHCTMSGAAVNAATPVARINENTSDNNGFLPVKIKNPNENQKTN